MKSLLLIIVAFFMHSLHAESLVIVGSEKKFNLIPKLGISKIKNDYFEATSEISVGLIGDIKLNSRFSVGPVFNITHFTLFEDYYAYNYPQMPLSQYEFGFQTKYYLISDGMIRPLVSIGLSYTHQRLKFKNGNYPYGYSYYDEAYISFGSINTTIMGGTEISISRGIGIHLDARYTTNLLSGLNRKYNSDTVRFGNRYAFSDLEQTAYDLEDGRTWSFNIGLVIRI
jgi:opacity protein-like surface antigen